MGLAILAVLHRLQAPLAFFLNSAEEYWKKPANIGTSQSYLLFYYVTSPVVFLLANQYHRPGTLFSALMLFLGKTY